MEALSQFQELVTKHYEFLKDYPEFNEANSLYFEIQHIRTKLSELEEERLLLNKSIGVAAT